LYAGDNTNHPMISTDYGSTWTPIPEIPTGDNNGSCSMSNDGMYQVVATSGDKVYLSSDYGSTWTAVLTNQTWFTASISGDGKDIAVGILSGSLYVSSDYGVTWYEIQRDAFNNYQAAKLTDDGSTIYQTGGPDGVIRTRGVYTKGGLFSDNKLVATQEWTEDYITDMGIGGGISKDVYGKTIGNFYVHDENEYWNMQLTYPYGESKPDFRIYTSNTTLTKNTEIRMYDGDMTISGTGSNLVISNPLALNPAATWVDGSTSGQYGYVMPFIGNSYKKILIYLDNITDAGFVLTYPTAFTLTPAMVTNGTGLSISTMGASSITIPSSSGVSGWIILEGF